MINNVVVLLFASFSLREKPIRVLSFFMVCSEREEKEDGPSVLPFKEATTTEPKRLLVVRSSINKNPFQC